MNVPTVKIRSDDSGCSHMDGPSRKISGMVVWRCPLCGHDLVRTLDSNGVPTRLISIVKIV
jgi:hypothetical protein